MNHPMCATCAFFVQQSSEPVVGECHVDGPQVVPVYRVVRDGPPAPIMGSNPYMQDMIVLAPHQTLGMWPPTKGSNTCGQHPHRYKDREPPPFTVVS